MDASGQNATAFVAERDTERPLQILQEPTAGAHSLSASPSLPAAPVAPQTQQPIRLAQAGGVPPIAPFATYGLSPQEVGLAQAITYNARNQPLEEMHKQAVTNYLRSQTTNMDVNTGMVLPRFGLEQQQLGMEQQRIGIAARNATVQEALKDLQYKEFGLKKKLQTTLEPLQRRKIGLEISELERKKNTLANLDKVSVPLPNGQSVSLGDLETMQPGFISTYMKVFGESADDLNKISLNVTDLRARMDQITDVYGKDIGSKFIGGLESLTKQANENPDSIHAQRLAVYRSLERLQDMMQAAGQSQLKKPSDINKFQRPPGWKTAILNGTQEIAVNPEETTAWVPGVGYVPYNKNK